MSDYYPAVANEEVSRIACDLTKIWEGQFNAPGAAFKSLDAVKEELRKVLRAWLDDCGRTASAKMVLVLQQHLSPPQLCATSLTGQDAWRAMFVTSVARELGLELGLANLVFYKRSISNDTYLKHARREGFADDAGLLDDKSDMSDPSESNLSFGPIEEAWGEVEYHEGREVNEAARRGNRYVKPLEEVRAERFVDMEGGLIRSTPQVRNAAYRAYEGDSASDDTEDGDANADGAETGSVEYEEAVHVKLEDPVVSRETGQNDMLMVKMEEVDAVGLGGSDLVKMENIGDENAMLKREDGADVQFADDSRDQDSLIINEKMELIPVDACEAVLAAEKHDKQRYEGYCVDGERDDYWPGQLHRWYYRTALVLWPPYAARIVRDQASLDNICNELRCASSSSPSSNERQLAYFLAARFGETVAASMVLGAVTEASLRWYDQDLWIHAVNSCASKGGLLPASHVQRAFVSFGFPAVHSSVEDLIEKDPRNARIFTFLEGLRKWLLDANWDSRFNIQSPQRDVLAWVEQQWSLFRRSLRKPEAGDFEMLVELAADDGAAAWSNTILPQIVRTADYEMLRLYATHISADPLPRMGVEASRRIAEQLLNECVAKFEFPEYPAFKPDMEQCLVHLKDFTKTCLDLSFLEVVGRMFSRLVDGEGLPDMKLRATRLVLPLLAFTREHIPVDRLENLPEVFVSALNKLLECAISTYLHYHVITSLQPVTLADLTNIFQAARLPGGPKILAERVLPRLDDLQSNNNNIVYLIDAMHPLIPSLALPRSYTGPTIVNVFALAVKKYARVVPIQYLSNAANALERCIRVREPDAFWVLLKRIVDRDSLHARFHPTSPTNDLPDPPNALYRREDTPGQGVSAHAEVVTLVGKLKNMLTKYGRQDMFSSACSAVLRAWMHYVLGAAPQDQSKKVAEIERWRAKCACTQCAELQTFFLDQLDFETTVSGMQFTKKQHVLKFLEGIITTSTAEWTWGMDKKRILTVRKTESFKAYALWQARKGVAAQMLLDISPEADEQADVLGDEYMDLLEWMRGLTTMAALKRGLDAGHTTPERGLEETTQPSKKQRLV